MDWEGPEALEALEARYVAPMETTTLAKKQSSPEPVAKKEPDAEESTDDDSGDEYVAESTKPKLKVRIVGCPICLPLLMRCGCL